MARCVVSVNLRHLQYQEECVSSLSDSVCVSIQSPVQQKVAALYVSLAHVLCCPSHDSRSAQTIAALCVNLPHVLCCPSHPSHSAQVCEMSS